VCPGFFSCVPGSSRAAIVGVSENPRRDGEKRPNRASAAPQTARASPFTPHAAYSRRSSQIALQNRCVPGSSRFWITNLEVMTGLIGDHESEAMALSQRVSEAIAR
jgi:hypothetical protein